MSGLVCPFTDRLHLTEVDVEVEGDAFFPDVERDQWEEVERIPMVSEPDRPNYAFVQYRRTPGSG